MQIKGNEGFSFSWLNLGLNYFNDREEWKEKDKGNEKTSDMKEKWPELMKENWKDQVKKEERKKVNSRRNDGR